MPQTRKPLRIAALAAVPLLAAGIAWWATRDGAPQSAEDGHDHATMTASGGDTARSVTVAAADQRRIGITFAPVTLGPLGREVRAVGQVAVDETRIRTISPKVDGWVEELYVDFTGQSIRRGAPLLTLYSPMLVTAQEELLLARRLTSDVAGASAETRRGTEDLVASARRRLAWWDVPADEIARVERTGKVQRTLTLRAPAGGVVLEKNVTAGQRIMAGDALYRVADLSTVWIEGDVYEQDLRGIRTGQGATAEFEALPGERFTGRVAYLYPTLSPETRTARIRIALANPGMRLKPGMYATLHVAGATRADALTVPRGAVLVTGERQIVFVRRRDGQLEPRQVQLGASSDDRVEVLRGVALGDTVVASATFLIDAESNLGTAMGGMGDMPGMELTLPPRPSDRAPAATSTPAAPRRAPPASMPGMDMPGAKAPASPRPASPSRPAADADAGHGGR